MAETLKETAVQAPTLASKIIKEMREGVRDAGIEWGAELVEGKTTIKEMIGTDDGAREFIEKVTYDLYTGREAVALAYKPITQH
jgi:hypothetical protein